MSVSGIVPRENLKNKIFLNHILGDGYTEQHRPVVTLLTGKVGHVTNYATCIQILQANEAGHYRILKNHQWFFLA
jgi:hypothetical protein